MKVPLSWLKEYVNITVPPADLAVKFTMAGNEVKGTEIIGGCWDNIVISRIVAINPHPNADRLTLVTVDLGTEQETVVCGAPNLKLGDKVAFARTGAQLIDPDTGQLSRLKPAKIRGVVSRGMVCSEKELGLSDNHQGIIVLAQDAPVSTPLADYLGDAIFDLDVTPNRADCLSIIGVAREAAVLTGQNLHLSEIEYEETASPVNDHIAVEIAAPDLCPRYCASLITNVTVGESPKWLQQRLQACGMRPVNNIVDITNYVMLEYGQPLHAFDYSRIRGKKIIVRRAAETETIVTLDGVQRPLSPDMLVIADTAGAVAVAGVMGGASSEVTAQTTSILLEAASFKPASIYHTGSALSLPSEARMRFERGIRPELTIPALKRATQMIVQLGGGRASRGIVDVYPGKKDVEPILLSTLEVKRLLGVEFGLDRIVAVLTSLGFECKPAASTSEIWVASPYWRSDIRLAVDLIEEVARIIGYDCIPSTMLSRALPRQNPVPILSLKRKTRQTLIGYGFQEIVTYSLTSLEMLNRLLPQSHAIEPLPLRMANPMTADQEYLRPTLRANLLSALAANRRYEDGGIRLFELGRVYLPQPQTLPEEPEIICGLLAGLRSEKSWQSNAALLDFYDAKGIVEGLLGRLGVEASFEESTEEGLHPNKQATIISGTSRLGVVGEVHPGVLESFEISEPACLFEVNLNALLPFAIGHRLFQPIPRFPAVTHDFALVVDVDTAHRKVLDIIKSFPLVYSIAIFDVYAGEQVPPGKKSLAYRIAFQSADHTLTDEEVNEVQRQILTKLSLDLGATLRA